MRSKRGRRRGRAGPIRARGEEWLRRRRGGGAPGRRAGPVWAGLVDRLEAEGIKAFGPTAAAARLEGSKGFLKDLCAANDIPTAAYGRFDKVEPALAFIRARGAPIVVKADGLAAG